MTCGSPSRDRKSCNFHSFTATREQNALQHVSSPMGDFKTSKLPSSAAMHPSSRNARKRSVSCVPTSAATYITENRSPTNGITLFKCWIARKTSGSSPAMAPSSAKVGAISRMIGGSMRGSCIWEPARGATRPKLSCTTRFTRAWQAPISGQPCRRRNDAPTIEHMRGHVRRVDEFEPLAETRCHLPHAHKKRVPIDLIVRIITLNVVDQDLGIVVRIDIPPLSRYVCHRLNACRDTDRELVRQQVTAEGFSISVANKALPMMRWIFSPDHAVRASSKPSFAFLQRAAPFAPQ